MRYEVTIHSSHKFLRDRVIAKAGPQDVCLRKSKPASDNERIEYNAKYMHKYIYKYFQTNDNSYIQ